MLLFLRFMLSTSCALAQNKRSALEHYVNK